MFFPVFKKDREFLQSVGEFLPDCKASDSKWQTVVLRNSQPDFLILNKYFASDVICNLWPQITRIPYFRGHTCRKMESESLKKFPTLYVSFLWAFTGFSY